MYFIFRRTFYKTQFECLRWRIFFDIYSPYFFICRCLILKWTNVQYNKYLRAVQFIKHPESEHVPIFILNMGTTKCTFFYISSLRKLSLDWWPPTNSMIAKLTCMPVMQDDRWEKCLSFLQWRRQRRWRGDRRGGEFGGCGLGDESYCPIVSYYHLNLQIALFVWWA